MNPITHCPTKRFTNIKFCLMLAIVFAWLLPSSVRAGAYEDFFAALARDDARAVARLLQRGFDPNTVDPQGRPALTIAMHEGSLRVAEVLIEHPQIDVNRLNTVGESALMLAALQGRLDWCQRLIERGAYVNKPGWAPLHYAASQSDVRLVQLMLDHHAYIDAESPNKTTPLMMAARYGSEDAAQRLLDEGADPTLRNELGLSAADFAKSVGRDRLAAQIERQAAIYGRPGR
ncbi:MAG TPA: ankyrin repeat domain-containing protein [Burkholderiaceae bacterium]|nr:ankyrin repeat domain-containing protein [Burkholderiaceae bacterium]